MTGSIRRSSASGLQARNFTGSEGLRTRSPAVEQGAVIAGFLLILSASLWMTSGSAVIGLAVGIGLATLYFTLALGGLVYLARLSLLLCALTLPWNALEVAGVQVAYVTLAATTVVWAFQVLHSKRAIHMPSWSLVLSAAVIAVFALHEFFPTDLNYLLNRYETIDPAVVYADAEVNYQTNLSNAAKWLVALVGLTFSVCSAASSYEGNRSSERFVELLLGVWVVGVVVSCCVAILDFSGLTSISHDLLPLVDYEGRQAGLTLQSNHLAVSAAISAPVVVGLFGRRYPAVAIVSTVILLSAVWLSGSRGGLVGTVVAISACLCTYRAGRRILISVLSAVCLAAPVSLMLLNVQVSSSLFFDLFGRSATAQARSNQVRFGVASQALTDFSASPVDGIGLQVITQAHSIYLQLLAAGGLILALAFTFFAVRAFRTVQHAHAIGLRLAVPVGISLATWLVIGTLENQLHDAYLYIPIASLTAAIYAHEGAIHALRRDQSPEASVKVG